MQELILNDRGGVTIKPEELIADKLMVYIEGLNPELGTDKDPRLDDLKAFMEDINSTAIIRIDPESISTGRFDDIDLTDDGIEAFKPDTIEELKDEYYTHGILNTINEIGEPDCGWFRYMYVSPFTDMGRKSQTNEVMDFFFRKNIMSKHADEFVTPDLLVSEVLDMMGIEKVPIK